MGVWKSEDTVITDAGLKLLGSITGSKVLQLTRAVAGEDRRTTAELSSLTEITHVKKNMTFTNFKDSGDGSAYVDVVIENKDLTEAFYHQQIGVYAKGTDGGEVLFLVSQAATPDYIPDKSSPMSVTHRIYIDYSSNKDASLTVSFAGFITGEDLQRELLNKEDVFSHHSAFNRDFNDDGSLLKKDEMAGKAGTSNLVARADHVHPVTTLLKYAENKWESGVTNYCPDTGKWIMSNGSAPTKNGGQDFEATFKTAWEDCHVSLSDAAVQALKGKQIKFGVKTFTGTTAQLEIDVDGAWGTSFTQVSGKTTVDYTVPASATSMTIRVIPTANSDLHIAFTGIYIYLADDLNAGDEGSVLYLELRKVAEDNLPTEAVPGTIYITEKGRVFFGKDDGTLLSLSSEDLFTEAGLSVEDGMLCVEVEE